eukprot:2117812-Prymnesium_polylepis.1
MTPIPSARTTAAPFQRCPPQARPGPGKRVTYRLPHSRCSSLGKWAVGTFSLGKWAVSGRATRALQGQAAAAIARNGSEVRCV